MSLFGGSAQPWRSSYESNTSESSSARSSPSVVEITNAQNTQEAQPNDMPIPLDVDDDIDTDAESEESESEEEDDDEEPARPNRFGGKPHTWQAYTEADRQIAESLEQLQDSDLSAHLYNAHALKQRLQLPARDLARLNIWHNRDAWLRSGEDLKYTDAAGLVQDAMVPPPEWTAWPVPPTELPSGSGRPDSGLVRGPTDDWTIESVSKQDAGEELREELLAVFLRIAKDRWNMRDVSSASDAETSRSQSRSKYAASSRSRSASRAGVRRKSFSGVDGETAGYETDEQDDAFGKERSRREQLDTFTEPVVLADDARAQRLLQPSIQSIMSKLDELALTICQTRFSSAVDDDSSMSEFTSGAESSETDSKPSWRARSRTATSRRPRTRSSSRATVVPAGHVVGQSTQDKGNVNAGDNDATSDDASDWEASNHLHERKRRRSWSSEGDSGVSTIGDDEAEVGLLDWSQVLGLAAVRGWDEGAIARTAQRCAALFGESMSLVPCDESLVSKLTSKPTWYTPSTSPAMDIPSATRSSAYEPPLSESGVLRCPHTDCYGHEQDFESLSCVAEHCSRVHGYDPTINDFENEENMDGCVHTDCFLQPVLEEMKQVEGEQEPARNRSQQHVVSQGSSQGASEAAVSAED
jgi:hypothetical protein